MEIPLVVDPNDPRRQLLDKILNIFEMRKTKKIIAKFTQIKTAINCMKIVLTSMFSTRVSHVVEELEQREDLREFLRIKEEIVPEAGYIYSFLSRFDLNDFILMILRILNSVTKKGARNTRLIEGYRINFKLPANRGRAMFVAEPMKGVRKDATTVTSRAIDFVFMFSPL